MYQVIGRCGSMLSIVGIMDGKFINVGWYSEEILRGNIEKGLEVIGLTDKGVEVIPFYIKSEDITASEEDNTLIFKNIEEVRKGSRGIIEFRSGDTWYKVRRVADLDAIASYKVNNLEIEVSEPSVLLKMSNGLLTTVGTDIAGRLFGGYR